MIPRAMKLFASEYLSGILIQHPEEIGSLAGIAEGSPPVGSGYLFAPALGHARPAGDPIFSYLQDSSSSYAEKLALLRRRFRHRIFAVGARDLTELRGVYESLAAATSIAEEAIEAAFGIAGKPAGLAVLALGRLGSGEFDVLSDADLLFVCDEGSDHQEQGKAVERIMQTLAAYTRDGTVFPVDTRLRPRGNEGELLVTPAQFSDYSQREAHPWEALSYSKLRFVAGSRDLAERAMAAARILFQRFAAEPGFLQSVIEMRAKLDVAEAPGKSFKTSPGGIYDIDFLSSYLLIKHGIAEKNGNLRDRIWRCAGSGLLKNVDAAALDHAAEFLRTIDHVVRLVMGRARKWLPATEHACSVTTTITEQLLQREFAGGLEAELAETCGRVRTIYSRVLTGG
ncbi:MAG: hypothetical protein JOY93_00350 [Acidobacteriales bacterium]|nr:hypothetical protein [Terriglobales bacterium]